MAPKKKNKSAKLYDCSVFKSLETNEIVYFSVNVERRQNCKT